MSMAYQYPTTSFGNGIEKFTKSEKMKMVKKLKVVSFHVLNHRENTFPIKKITSRDEMIKKMNKMCKRNGDENITFIISAGKNTHGHFKITLTWDNNLEEFIDIIAAAYVEPNHVSFCDNDVKNVLLQVVIDTMDKI